MSYHVASLQVICTLLLLGILSEGDSRCDVWRPECKIFTKIEMLSLCTYIMHLQTLNSVCTFAVHVTQTRLHGSSTSLT